MVDIADRRAPHSGTCQITDDELLRAFRNEHSETALQALLDRHWPRVARLTERIVCDPAAAADAAQRTFIKVARGAPGYEARGGFGGWLCRVALNEARDAAVARKRRRAHEAEAAKRQEERNAESGGHEGGRAGALEHHLRQLPVELRIPLVLRYVDGLTHSEVAEALQVPAGTASSRIRRSLEQLKRSLERAGLPAALPALERWLGEGAIAEAPTAPQAASLLEAALTGPGHKAPPNSAPQRSGSLTASAAPTLSLPALAVVTAALLGLAATASLLVMSRDETQASIVAAMVGAEEGHVSARPRGRDAAVAQPRVRQLAPVIPDVRTPPAGAPSTQEVEGLPGAQVTAKPSEDPLDARYRALVRSAARLTERLQSEAEALERGPALAREIAELGPARVLGLRSEQELAACVHLFRETPGADTPEALVSMVQELARNQQAGVSVPLGTFRGQADRAPENQTPPFKALEREERRLARLAGHPAARLGLTERRALLRRVFAQCVVPELEGVFWSHAQRFEAEHRRPPSDLAELPLADEEREALRAFGASIADGQLAVVVPGGDEALTRNPAGDFFDAEPLPPDPRYLEVVREADSLSKDLLFAVLERLDVLVDSDPDLDAVRDDLAEEEPDAGSIEELHQGWVDVRAEPRVMLERLKRANESAAIASLRTLVTVQSLYRDVDKDGDGLANFAPTLADLSRHGQLIDPRLASGEWRGYRYELASGDRGLSWTCRAVPTRPGATGDRSFFVNESGVIRFARGERPGPASIPIGG